MKVTLKYEESERDELQMTLRLTLPQKYVNGRTQAVVKLFVDHYNKKHAENTLDATALHLKVVGGEHLTGDQRVCDVLASGDECYLLGESSLQRAGKRAAVAKADEAAPSPAPAAAAAAPSQPSASSSKAAADGKVRCKNFGCQRMFDPNGPPQECCHHKSPPIFHETAKWWSCCPDAKAYDWEEFMKIPGCQKSFCTRTPEGQKDQKRFLGGADLRGDSAPIRLDADAPMDPRRKLAAMTKGLVAIGVDAALVEKVWAKLASENADLEKVCEQLRARFLGVLNRLE